MTDDRQMDETQPEQSQPTGGDQPVTEGDGQNFGDTKIVPDDQDEADVTASGAE